MALDIDDPVRRSLAAVAQRLDEGDAAVRWVARENLHVTLNFLGDVAEIRLPEVCRAAAKAASQIPAFVFSIGQLCCMPPGPKGRIIWADVEDPDEHMRELHAALTDAMTELDFAPEHRGFRGHVTLARIKQPGRAAQLRDEVARLTLPDLSALPQCATEVVVYTSLRGHAGPTYIPAAHCPLAPDSTSSV